MKMAKKTGNKNVESVTPTKSVTVKKVNNGFIVSKYDSQTGREKEIIAKTSKEAMRVTQKMFRGK
jgi:hypothetical protein